MEKIGIELSNELRYENALNNRLKDFYIKEAELFIHNSKKYYRRKKL